MGILKLTALIVEDSPVTREFLTYLLEEEAGFLVVGTAKNGKEGVDLAERLRPDIVLMDIHMPELNGLEATKAIMNRAPTRIVMVSASLDPQDVALSFQALKAGALALVEKPKGPNDPNYEVTVRELVMTLRLMSEVKVVRQWKKREAPIKLTRPLVAADQKVRVIGIGASTGGPQVLSAILRALPSSFPLPVLVVQHIALGFTNGLVSWLDQECRLAVTLARTGETLRPGRVYVAPEGQQLGVTSQGRIQLSRDTVEEGFCPSATYLFRSLAEAFGPAAMGIVLNGMGRDGASGLLDLRKAGGLTVAQDEKTSIVFGMPGEAIKLGAVRFVLSPNQIVGLLTSLRATGAGLEAEPDRLKDSRSAL